jgi:Txe/YoeB family toxin of Txe-Axe toxin-antitoxin module
MSELDELLKRMKVEEYGITPRDETKRQIKQLIFDLLKESEYEPYAFVEKVEKL